MKKKWRTLKHYWNFSKSVRVKVGPVKTEPIYPPFWKRVRFTWGMYKAERKLNG